MHVVRRSSELRVHQLGVEPADGCSRLDEGPAAVRGRLAANMIAIANRGCSAFVRESSEADRLDKVGD